ncbi:MAG: prepilin-type N-terminal cleavage/methylation domain-containing protein [Phycisphaerales bacterium]|nr:prepilin-type N-terminal cleavage/methylation domain-containing protein [Phycisphaerales bacterium]
MRVGALHHRQCLCLYRRGFTIIELMVVLGVVLVLVSMFVPTIAKSIEEARNTRDAAQLRQNVTLVDLYCNDQKGIYPIESSEPADSVWRWYVPLRAIDLVTSEADVDPWGWRVRGAVRFTISFSMIERPETFRPGNVPPLESRRTSPIRQDQVFFPSDKGVMLRSWNGISDPQNGGNMFCCGPRWRTPISMADGSGLTTDYLTLSGNVHPLVINLVGMPIVSTWGGCQGRDR